MKHSRYNTQARIKKRLAESYDRTMARVIEQTRNANFIAETTNQNKMTHEIR